MCLSPCSRYGSETARLLPQIILDGCCCGTPVDSACPVLVGPPTLSPACCLYAFPLLFLLWFCVASSLACPLSSCLIWMALWGRCNFFFPVVKLLCRVNSVLLSLVTNETGVCPSLSNIPSFVYYKLFYSYPSRCLMIWGDVRWCCCGFGYGWNRKNLYSIEIGLV